jgi:3-hydroxyisobutyrate dehydrogenase-like beta-hydroxyacid dehydrogenase
VDEATMHAGFIGLGDIGLPMAQRIVASGLPTTVWGRRPSSTDPLVECGASVADSPAALGAACEVIGICVFDGAGVEEVMFGPAGVVAGMRPGGVVAVHSTVAPAQIAAIAEKAAAAGITVLDAPVSGGAPAAAEGELLVMLGGPAGMCAKAMPVIGTYAGQTVWFAAAGEAQLAKLINNALLASQVALVFDALRLGEQHGLGTALVDVLRSGSARSFALEIAAGAGSAQTLARTQFAPTIGKDVVLLGDAVGQAGEPVLLTTARTLLHEMAADRSARSTVGEEKTTA